MCISTETTPSIHSEYHQFADVFFKHKASALSDHRPYDCTIDLQDGKVPSCRPIYALSQKGKVALKKFIDNNLNKVSSEPLNRAVAH